ncbi:hypothetical protein [Metamycoplasma gateae]|uniref:Uncharacterized protein n=1 Tax=Metamycoplasma gateae TaxID=35769 RepID=A0ABZ2AH61_9BACT|nr:hypothetical protein V2E26_00355 [Metamycoplasma gateae]
MVKKTKMKCFFYIFEFDDKQWIARNIFIIKNAILNAYIIDFLYFTTVRFSLLARF